VKKRKKILFLECILKLKDISLFSSSYVLYCNKASNVCHIFWQNLKNVLHANNKQNKNENYKMQNFMKSNQINIVANIQLKHFAVFT
jgi:hypothetical protein